MPVNSLKIHDFYGFTGTSVVLWKVQTQKLNKFSEFSVNFMERKVKNPKIYKLLASAEARKVERHKVSLISWKTRQSTGSEVVGQPKLKFQQPKQNFLTAQTKISDLFPSWEWRNFAEFSGLALRRLQNLPESRRRLRIFGTRIVWKGAEQDYAPSVL